jgi:hypothetical protein
MSKRNRLLIGTGVVLLVVVCNGVSEMYLPYEKAHQKKPVKRQWGTPGRRNEEASQPTCWMVVQVP